MHCISITTFSLYGIMRGNRLYGSAPIGVHTRVRKSHNALCIQHNFFHIWQQCIGPCAAKKIALFWQQIKAITKQLSVRLYYVFSKCFALIEIQNSRFSTTNSWLLCANSYITVSIQHFPDCSSPVVILWSPLLWLDRMTACPNVHGCADIKLYMMYLMEIWQK